MAIFTSAAVHGVTYKIGIVEEEKGGKKKKGKKKYAVIHPIDTPPKKRIVTLRGGQTVTLLGIRQRKLRKKYGRRAQAIYSAKVNGIVDALQFADGKIRPMIKFPGVRIYIGILPKPKEVTVKDGPAHKPGTDVLLTVGRDGTT